MSRRELTKAVRDRYLRSSKKEKSAILKEFVASTGYHRKYALALLHGRVPQRHGAHRRRKVAYSADVADALTFIWKVCDRIASRRLHPFLPEMVAILERQNELQMAASTRDRLLTMSRSTMDRLLAPARRAMPRRGRSTTKPGTLLKKSIPIRTWADWDNAKPGFLEIDLVAHCGDSTDGDYLATLNCVDVATGWCECIVPRNRGQQAVWAALVEIRQRLPIPLLGIDSDNDAAFINHHLKGYCDQEKITFTRARSYKKNDQAHVEQKNWTGVRRYVGYARYEEQIARVALNAFYRDLRLYMNFFQPVMKLTGKTRVDGKVKKVYDTAQTPYQRLLASPDVSLEDKQKLTRLYETLNPVSLYNAIDRHLHRIWQLHAREETAK